MTCQNPCHCPVHAAKQAREKTRNKRDRAAYMREYRKRLKAEKQEKSK